MRRERGTVRTSTRRAIRLRWSRSTKRSTGCVECPIVKISSMARKLDEYKRKRDFESTPEPAAEPRETQAEPAFAAR
jgi:hypothetical protein